MLARLVGLGLTALGILFAVLFVYLPIRDGADGFMGPVRIKALVFIPLAVLTGLAFAIGGAPVLNAFQAKQKSRQQLTLVLSVIIGSAVVSGLAFWQIKSRWLREPEPVIIRTIPKPPQIPNSR